jgi:hypothetical protein
VAAAIDASVGDGDGDGDGDDAGDGADAGSRRRCCGAAPCAKLLVAKGPSWVGIDAMVVAGLVLVALVVALRVAPGGDGIAQ